MLDEFKLISKENESFKVQITKFKKETDKNKKAMSESEK